jgi:hypothetical protein
MNHDFAYGFGTGMLALSLTGLAYLICKLRAVDKRQAMFLSGQINRDEEIRDTIKRLVDETRRDVQPGPRGGRDMFGGT